MKVSTLINMYHLILYFIPGYWVASVQQLLQLLGNSDQTSCIPFPSLLFALLFFLIHSPHPMACF